VVLDDVSFEIEKGKFYTLLGPSGCGKTTILRLIAGFTEPTSGEIFFNGKKVNNIPANKRQVNTVFQDYALFPHLNVFDNVAFGLRVKKLPNHEIDRKSTRLNSSHVKISYAVFCLKKKTNQLIKIETDMLFIQYT